MAQMIATLVENAPKYTADWDRSGRAGTTARDVHITVKDTGYGVPAEEFTSIAAYRQLESNHATKGRPGLGLPLVHSLAELHGGAVYATSAGVGHGTCFTVRLPRDRHSHARGH
jgi:signal transduction histidine kinase